MAGRLLNVDVFACLTGPNGGQRMPVVWQRHGDRLDFLVGKNRLHVLVELGILSGQLSGQRLGALEVGLIDVAERVDVHVGKLGVLSNMVAAAAAGSDNGNIDAIICAPGSRGGECGKRSGLQKGPAGWVVHTGSSGDYGIATAAGRQARKLRVTRTNVAG